MILSNQYIKFNSRQIDLLKFVLAVLVVGVHTLSSVDFIGRPILRLGVPIFFIISSYLFFLKQESCASAQKRKQGLIKYVKRILKLYLFWFVVLFPITVYYNKWHINPSLDTMVIIVQNFFFNQTFLGSWYLMALILGIALVWALGEIRVNDVWIVIIGILLYLLCCMSTNYNSLVAKVPLLNQTLKSYEMVFSMPHNSFPAGILFIAMGKILAQHSFHVPNKFLFIAAFVLFVLLYCEFFWVKSFGEIFSDDCYLMLPPLCLCLFMLIGQNEKYKFEFNTKPPRAYSTIIYCSHISIAFCLYGMLRNYVEYNTTAYQIMSFLITLALSSVLAFLILKLEKRRHFCLLNYSH